MGVFRQSAHLRFLFSDLTEKLLRFRQRFVDLTCFFPSALCTLRTPSTFTADNRGDLLDQLVRLKFRGEFFRNGSDYRNVSIFCTREEHWAAEFRFQRVDHSFQEFSIG